MSPPQLPSRTGHLQDATVLVLLVGALVTSAPLGCTDSGQFKTPLVRVDLSAKLPPKVQRLRDTAIPFDCSRKLTLADGGIAPRFNVAWRVLDFRQARYIAAVEVVPDGRVDGVRGLSGAGWVGEPVDVGEPAEAGESQAAAVTAVPVKVRWTARKGCSEIGQGQRLELRADDRSCKKLDLPKLLRSLD